MDSPHASVGDAYRSGDQIVLSGQVEEGGVRFEARLRVRTERRGWSTAKDREIFVTGATSAT